MADHANRMLLDVLFETVNIPSSHLAPKADYEQPLGSTPVADEI